MQAEASSSSLDHMDAVTGCGSSDLLGHFVTCGRDSHVKVCGKETSNEGADTWQAAKGRGQEHAFGVGVCLNGMSTFAYIRCLPSCSFLSICLCADSSISALLHAICTSSLLTHPIIHFFKVGAFQSAHFPYNPSNNLHLCRSLGRTRTCAAPSTWLLLSLVG